MSKTQVQDLNLGDTFACEIHTRNWHLVDNNGNRFTRWETHFYNCKEKVHVHWYGEVAVIKDPDQVSALENLFVTRYLPDTL